MIQWGAVSFAHFFDTRMVGLSWADRGVLYHLALIASTAEDGATVVFQQRPGEALATTWSRALGEGGATSVGRLVEQGLLVLCPEGLRIVLRAERHGKAPAVGDAWVVPSSVAERPQGAVTTQGKPSASKAAQRARNDRAKFATRSAPFKDAPEGVKWEAWVATAEGRTFVEMRDLEFPGYRAWVTPQGNAVGNTPGNARVTPQGNTPSETSFSSENSEEEKKEEREVGEGNAVPTARVTPQGNTPKVTPSGRALLDAMNDAAGEIATLTGPSAVEAAVCAAMARAHLTLDEAHAMGEALATPHLWCPPSKGVVPPHITLRILAGFRTGAEYDCAPLDALIAHVRGKRRGAPAPDEAQRARANAKTAAWLEDQAKQKQKRAVYAAQQQETAAHE